MTPTFRLSFNLITSFLFVFQTRAIFYILVSKIRAANWTNFKLSQQGEFIIPGQSGKYQPKNITTEAFIRWSVFFEYGSRGPCKDDAINLFLLILGVEHFVEGSYFIHTLHLISSIVLQSFNLMTSLFCILKSVSFVEKKHRSEILSFSPRPTNFNSKKIITAVTVS